MKKLLPFLVSMALMYPALAQQVSSTPGPAVTLHFGLVHGGSGHGIEKQVKDNGFGEESTASGFFFGPEDNPVREEATIQLGLKFPVREKHELKGLLNYRETDVTGNAVFYDPLEINTSVLTVAALAYVPIQSRLFRAGLGPAFHLAKATVTQGENDLKDDSFSKVGFVLESGISYPRKSRFYADLQVQYIYVGKNDLGNFTVTGTDATNRPTSKSVGFSDTSFSSVTVSIGAGFRFRKG